MFDTYTKNALGITQRPTLNEEHLHQKWEIFYFKIKIIAFIINLR